MARTFKLKRQESFMDSQGKPFLVEAGTLVYEYMGNTYDCCTRDEVPVTLVPQKTPFHGTLFENLEEQK